MPQAWQSFQHRTIAGLYGPLSYCPSEAPTESVQEASIELTLYPLPLDMMVLLPHYQTTLPFGNEYVISGTCSLRYTY